MEKRKNKHYQELINSNQSFCPTTFFTAGALTTGGLCNEFIKLIRLINIIAQYKIGGWDPIEIIEGIRNGIAVSIQEGNSIVINDSWNKIAERNMNHLLRGGNERQRRSVNRATNDKRDTNAGTRRTRRDEMETERENGCANVNENADRVEEQEIEMEKSETPALSAA